MKWFVKDQNYYLQLQEDHYVNFWKSHGSEKIITVHLRKVHFLKPTETVPKDILNEYNKFLWLLK